jgi:hypothetical protein
VGVKYTETAGMKLENRPSARRFLSDGHRLCRLGFCKWVQDMKFKEAGGSQLDGAVAANLATL